MIDIPSLLTPSLLIETIRKCDDSHFEHGSQIAYTLLVPVERFLGGRVVGIEEVLSYIDQINTSLLVEIIKEDFRNQITFEKNNYNKHNLYWENFTKEYMLAFLDAPESRNTEEYSNLEGFWDDGVEEGSNFNWIEAIEYYLIHSNYIVGFNKYDEDVRDEIIMKYTNFVHETIANNAKEIVNSLSDILYKRKEEK